jgi:hypothetical protein
LVQILGVGNVSYFGYEIATLDGRPQCRTIAVMFRRTKAGDTGAARAGRSVLYPLGLVTASIAIREGVVMASSLSSSLSLASVNNPSSRMTSAIV